MPASPLMSSRRKIQPYRKALLRRGFLLLTSLAASLATADSSPQSLARSPYWHLLLRDGRPQDGHYQSEVADPGFFLAADGAHDASSELLTSIEAFRVATSGDNSPACRFPARHAWLSEHLAEAKHWPIPHCPALDIWLAGIAPDQATLVFASDYSGNPSSLFGHTFLRIDAVGQSHDQRLLSYAINFQAEAFKASSLLFAVNGLTGGLKASFSLLPYYDKVKEYNHLESRDLWEYELNLPPMSVRRLLLTYWEWRHLKLPYYFLSRNCSYELLGLLEAAQPGVWLRERFPAQAIPADTLKAVTQAPGMVRRITWRPARDTKLDAQARQQNASVNAMANALIDGAKPEATLENLTRTEKAQALETAHDELHARLLDGHVSPAIAGPRLRQLLTQRARLDVPDQRTPPVQPIADPTLGHAPQRIGFGWSHGHDNRALLLSFRPAYHDWLDSSAGYRPGSRLEVLSGTLRIDDSGHFGIHQADLFALESLSPLTPFRTPLSWSIRLGADRLLGDRGKTGTLTLAEASAGLAVPFEDNTQCFTKALADTRGSRVLDRGWENGLGLRMGCVGDLNTSVSPLRWQVEVRPVYRWPADTMTWNMNAGLQLTASREQALRLTLRREWRDEIRSSIDLMWLRYF